MYIPGKCLVVILNFHGFKYLGQPRDNTNIEKLFFNILTSRLLAEIRPHFASYIQVQSSTARPHLLLAICLSLPFCWRLEIVMDCLPPGKMDACVRLHWQNPHGGFLMPYAGGAGSARAFIAPHPYIPSLLCQAPGPASSSENRIRKRSVVRGEKYFLTRTPFTVIRFIWHTDKQWKPHWYPMVTYYTTVLFITQVLIHNIDKSDLCA